MARYPDEDWQSSKTVEECNQYMWSQQLACDVTFIVGPAKTRIGAHKYVLSSRSCVFFAMFHGPLSENTGNVVEIPDMTTDQIKTLLQFLYTGKVRITSQDVLAVLYAAKKYCVQTLINRCLGTLKRDMNPQNICMIMENSHIYGSDDLKSKCHSYILQYAEEVFSSNNVKELCEECFASILDDEKLPVSETEIFMTVWNYAKTKYLENEQSSPDVLREKMKHIIRKVRFPLMNQEFFNEIVEPSKLLTDSQILQVYKYFLNKRADDCPDFVATERKCQYTVHRFTDVASGWGYKRDNRDAISFTCSQDIVFKGLLMYGSDQGPADLDIHIHFKELKERDTHVFVERFLVETDGKQKTEKLLFQNSLVLHKDTLYTIEAIVRGCTTYYGSGGLEVVEKNQVIFRFKNTPRSTNNTSVTTGQVAAIIFEMIEDNDSAR